MSLDNQSISKHKLIHWTYPCIWIDQHKLILIEQVENVQIQESRRYQGKFSFDQSVENNYLRQATMEPSARIDIDQKSSHRRASISRRRSSSRQPSLSRSECQKIYLYNGSFQTSNDGTMAYRIWEYFQEGNKKRFLTCKHHGNCFTNIGVLYRHL